MPPIWLLLALALGWALDRFVPLWGPDWPALRATGQVLAACGIALIAWPVGQFLAARTGLVPFSEATTLVTGGLYRLTRNPMYLGMSLMLFGAGVMLGSLGALLPVPLFMAVIQKRFIEPEERQLEAAFGDDFRAYRARVRRWL